MCYDNINAEEYVNCKGSVTIMTSRARIRVYTPRAIYQYIYIHQQMFISQFIYYSVFIFRCIFNESLHLSEYIHHEVENETDLSFSSLTRFFRSNAWKVMDMTVRPARLPKTILTSLCNTHYKTIIIKCPPFMFQLDKRLSNHQNRTSDNFQRIPQSREFPYSL